MAKTTKGGTVNGVYYEAGSELTDDQILEIQKIYNKE